MTPYESLLEKKVNLEYLSVFSCLAYAKVEATHLKKLDDWSQTFVHIGIELGNKAYTLQSINTKVLVSRNVVFDEKTVGAGKTH